MRHLVAEAGLAGRIHIESAGTGDWHVGEPRDRRSREVGERRGIPLVGRARQFVVADFARFDWVLAMDGKNQADLEAMAPDEIARRKIFRLRAFQTAGGPHPAGGPPAASGPDADVPDPYYGGADGFDRVFDICLAACQGLLARIRAELDT